MGIEPTSHPCGRRNGFEDRGDHQVSSTPKFYKLILLIVLQLIFPQNLIC